ncbi:MAG: hypothetical protein JSR85_04025 [Proteobacteria bacterium]|nr:hypothetical protein [Pseudomonadota bacterium]
MRFSFVMTSLLFLFVAFTTFPSLCMRPEDGHDPLTRLPHAQPAPVFSILTDLSKESEDRVNQILKVSIVEVGLGAFMVNFSPYVPALGSSVNQPKNAIGPDAIKVMGRSLTIHGLRELISAAHEKYNIWRGSRLPPAEAASRVRAVRNAFADVGLAIVLHKSQTFIPTVLEGPFIELGGPAVFFVVISAVAIRGASSLVKNLPPYIGELDWYALGVAGRDKAVSYISWARNKISSFFSMLGGACSKREKIKEKAA